MELMQELRTRNEALKLAVESNNQRLARFEAFKSMISSQYDVNRRLKLYLRTGESEMIVYIRNDKMRLVLAMYELKYRIRDMQGSIASPPLAACQQFELENSAIRSRIQQISVAYYPDLQVPRRQQSPEQRFLLCYSSFNKRTDSTLIEPRKIALFVREVTYQFNCLSAIRSQFYVLQTNTARNPTFLMAFGILPEIARAHSAYSCYIYNFFQSKWCARLERTLLAWLDNLPEIEELKGMPRASDRRWFAADEREFGSGKVANFLMTALLLQGWELIADAGGVGVQHNDQVIYV